VVTEGQKNRIRFGTGGSLRRDFTVWTTNGMVKVDPGDTYVWQQYLVTGRLAEMPSIAQEWKPEVYEDIYSLGEMSGTDIHLISTDDATFGALVSEEGASCSGEVRCTGKSVPQFDSTALFAISCGNNNYVGSDQYHFSPSIASDNIIRSYACEGEAIDVRPVWKLLGFFEEGSCDFLQNAVYDSNFCSCCDSVSSSPSVSTTLSPSSVSASPSLSTTLSPSSVSASPSLSPIVPPSCEDSPLEIRFQGNNYSCEEAEALDGCTSNIIQSHCPSTCNACDEYECADSMAPWEFRSNKLRCSQLANEDLSDIIFVCSRFSQISTTCRFTCGLCAD